MSDNAIQTLEAFLDQTLAPLPIHAGHRKQMREEMLAHLLGIFDDEMTRSDDEAKAVAATLFRFGAVGPLQTDLDASVTFWERNLTWALCQKEKNMWRLFLVLGVVAVLVGMAFVMPAVQQMLYQEVLLLSVGLLILGTAVCLGGVWSFVHGVRRFRVRNL